MLFYEGRWREEKRQNTRLFYGSLILKRGKSTASLLSNMTLDTLLAVFISCNEHLVYISFFTCHVYWIALTKKIKYNFKNIRNEQVKLSIY